MKIKKEEVLIFLQHLGSHLTAATLGWLFGKLDYGLGGAVFIICSLYSWHLTFQETKKKEAELARKFFINEKETVQQIFDDIPRWIFFPDVERAEWINKMLTQLWPDVTAYIYSYIRNDLEASIRKCLPSKLQTFRFSKVDLGDLPPKVSGIKVYEVNTSRDEIVVDVDVFYAGDANLSLSISKISAGIKGLQLRGTARIVFTPLIDRPPFVGGIKVYLLTKPSIGFDLTNLASVFEVPGLYSLLKQAILSYINDYLVLPNMLTFPFSSDVSHEKLKVTEPKGVLRVELVQAKGIKRCDITSKSDPYAVLEVGGESYSSTVVKNNHNPVWHDQLFYFTVMEVEGVSLSVSVFDDDDQSKDDSIGGSSMSLKALVEEGEVDTWKSLGEDAGSVHFRTQWYSLTSDETDISNIESKITPACVVSVYLDSACRLSNPLTPTLDPSTVVKLRIAGKSLTSKAVQLTPKPRYEENFTFRIDNPYMESLTADVLDVKSKKSLGHVVIPLSRCLQSDDMTLRCQPYNLRGSNTNAELILRASVKFLAPVVTSKLEIDTDLTHETSGEPLPSPNDEHQELTPHEGISTDSTSFDTASVVTSSTVDSADSSVRPRSSTAGSGSLLPRPQNILIDSQRKKVNAEILATIAGHDLSLERRRRSHGDVMVSSSPRVGSVGNRKSSLVEGNQGLGQIQISVNYNMVKEKLKITVHQCRDLRVINDVYVKVYLLPNKDSKKSQIVKDTCNPVFNESLDFDVKSTDASKKMLEVVVKSYESIFSREELGQVLLKLSDFDLPALTTRWYALEPVL